MGTDSTGRDSFSRIVYGGQISLIIGILAVMISVSVGTVIGGVAAYYGGWVDAVLMRFTEAMLSIPPLFLLIVLGKFLGRDMQTIKLFGRSFSGSVGIVIVVIGLTSWMYLARIVRANVLSLKEMDYISASKSLGASNVRIFFTHLVPNTLGIIIVSATLGSGWRDPFRGLCIIPWAGRSAADGLLGQHAHQRPILYPERRLVDVGLPQPVHRFYDPVHQPDG